MKFRPLVAFSFCVVLPALALGCSGEPDQIERYQVDKQHILFERNHVDQSVTTDAVTTDAGPITNAPIGKPTDRMLAALVPHQDKVWSFKVTGPIPAVNTIAGAFRAFVQAVKFAGGNPKWDLPEGWRQLPAGQASPTMIKRFATIKIDAAGQTLDLSIMPIPAPPDDYQGYLLANVNRWRGQMRLPPLRADQLKDQSTEIEVDGNPSTFVDLRGISSGGMRGPFAPGPDASTLPRATAPQAAASAIKFDVPKGWKKAQLGAFSKASFTVTEKDKTVQISATDLAAAAGDLLSNVNRWRRQISLGPVTQAELTKQLKPFQIDKVTGHYVELLGPVDSKPRNAIWGIIAIHGTKAWFFKLKGDADLALREKQRFEAFARSIRFN